MSLTSDRSPLPPAEARLARAQAEIRALTVRGALPAQERLELARWQRAWLDAWRELVSVRRRENDDGVPAATTATTMRP